MKLIFDVESVGLHGEGWAVGFVLQDRGETILEGYFACPHENAIGTVSDRKWVEANCPRLEPTHSSPREVRNAFWQMWCDAKSRGAILWADCCWPVETNFLSACVADSPGDRAWNGPYPLHEIATVFELKGIDPTSKSERLIGEEEHHPLGDARQSARLLNAISN